MSDMGMEMHRVLCFTIYGSKSRVHNWLGPFCPHREKCSVGVHLPGLASDKNLAGVHDTAGQACGVDGAQSRAELDDVGPDQGLGEQACVLPRWGGFMLPCTERNASNLTSASRRG